MPSPPAQGLINVEPLGVARNFRPRGVGFLNQIASLIGEDAPAQISRSSSTMSLLTLRLRGPAHDRVSVMRFGLRFARFDVHEEDVLDITFSLVLVH